MIKGKHYNSSKERKKDYLNVYEIFKAPLVILFLLLNKQKDNPLKTLNHILTLRTLPNMH